MFTIPNTKALALGGAGILIASLFVLFRNQTSSDAELSLPENTSPNRYRTKKLLNKGKFYWEDAKVPNPNALSESEEREFIREKIIPLSLQLPTKTPAIQLKGLQHGASGEEVIYALVDQTPFWFRQMPDAYLEDENYFYVWCKGFLDQGYIIYKNTFKYSKWYMEDHSGPKLFGGGRED